MREDVQNRLEMLDSIIRSLKGYPNFGGEVGVLKEVKRLRREARIEALEWMWNKNGDELRAEIVRLKGEK